MGKNALFYEMHLYVYFVFFTSLLGLVSTVAVITVTSGSMDIA